MSWLAGPSPLTGALGGLSAFGSLLGGGLSPSSSASVESGPVTPTGWGALNNPFIVATRGAAVSDVSARQDAPVSLDQRPSVGGGFRAPLVGGEVDAGGFVTLAVVGIGVFLIVALLRRG